ncbi:putative bifunctional diguanylate cyclase/phosphodiesterase [Sphingomonas faeni]|uniref:putative bifunctional diguanylate cyclase/phosphodiesterase n=1 Tax=Sphingomonas faeni TaxID=185950 RepID=UPI00277E9D86|nr:EAL domain-containing protein [Sphingomonas faeni]MDQ0840026.1 diguanylate cyclase (GGDEF)-like protein/PAS domain S-box-containing protein [Sphingomonas faeni]
MRMDVPTDWAGNAIKLPPASVVDGGSKPSLERIVAEAMHATGCSTAIVCRERDGQLAIVAGNGNGTLQGIVPVVLNADPACQSGILATQFIDDAPASPIGFHAGHGSGVRFAAAARIASDEDAFLVVLHDRDHAPLSAAQTYVLRAHAAHLATMFKLARLRERVELVDDTAHARVERLRLLESVAVHARDSIIITEAEPIDLPGPRILYCNAAFTRATGYSAAEMLGQTPRILQGPKTDPAARARLREALSAWEPVEIEMINYHKDGTEFWVELSIVPVADDRGWFTHWVSVQRDITERKEAEQLANRIRIAEFENRALATEIQERKRVEAELLYTAFHDNLTHLRNRAFFMERLTTALERARDEAFAACSVLFLDLDQFKVVNDSLGHIAGDALLKEIAQRLEKCVRPHTLARIGGDEFAILIEDGIGLDVPVRVAERIIEALRAPVQLGRQSVFPSCSIGIVQSADRNCLPEDLIRDADIAMYVAKRGGYGDYAIFDASMHDDAVARLTLQTDLRQAIDRDEFYLAYQPIVDPATGSIFGFEALLRWVHPERGSIAPVDFVPVAEEIGLIRQIDRWVMREGCAQLSKWQRQCSNPALRMNLNTSAAEFVDPDFLPNLSATLAEFGLQPQCLELEITEGIFLHPSPGIAATIAAIRKLGVRIALDDFGTGYSSLSYINRYAIDTIKIDKSFIDGVCTDPRTQAIIDLIVKLGRTLDVAVVAEGVETQEQADALTSIGCGAVQGFHFARPRSAHDATKLLGLANCEVPLNGS